MTLVNWADLWQWTSIKSLGGLTYAIEHDTCEIVTLDAHIVYRAAVELAPPLLDTMKPSDVQLACIPLTLLTTNDNLRAQ